MSNPLLLLGIGDQAAYSEFSLAQIAAAHPVVLADTTAPAWARPYLARHLTVDLSAAATTTAAVEIYAANHELGGVLTYMGQHLVTAARIARQLGLRGTPPEGLAVCANRVAVRRLLAQHKVPLARWAEARNCEAAASHADAIGYPVVIMSSIGNANSGLARTRSDVLAMFARLNGQALAEASHLNQLPGFLVEEQLDGPQIAAEVVVMDDGDAQIVAITRTTLGPPPARQAIRHCVYAHDSLLHNRLLRQTVARAVKALGVTFGVLHIEITLTARGPRITDVSAHLAGDLIPLLVKRATGIDLPQVAADLATRRPPNLALTRQRAAAVHFAYPTDSGCIEQLTVTAPAYHPLVDRVVITQEVGHRVVKTAQASVDDRLAHWVVLGDAAGDCHTALDQMAQDLAVEISISAAALDRTA
ncbi:biotin carboxylase [Streptomyces umbrinus]|uniref:Biotin carboxylase n=1 Tax=Streptomyces umbrinus TaxID=67370 RepID=A0ABU0SME0_9ACTN|nr:ATP-grasp domain-containing protein [Streptomyces umbrinus]MDQ1024718.1 biotin carboxylase [Streptomyces umbrinus]